MLLHYTRLAATAALSLALGAAVEPALAQGFPARPIHLFVTGAPGSSTDLIARRLAKIIQSQQQGATVVVENQGGASGSIALTSTMRSPPDGYRLVIAVPDSVTIYPLLKKVRPYNAEKELTPISQVAEAHFAFVVNAKHPANNMTEFVQAVKARPKGQVSYASPGSGTSARLVTEMLLQRANIEMLHAPYKSTMPGLQGVVGGEVDLMVTSLASAKALIDGGRLKAIGLTREKRLPGFDGVPTLAESGFPDFVVPVWWGVFAPANLPADVRDKLSAMFQKATETDEYREQLATLGLEPRTRPSGEFAAFLRADTDMWSSVIRKADIPLED
jgi:tripartite-type tricarboxylate transporter receptor subunit TctC